jgi:CubicO group peptidase (beta-lactamase class C family)
LIEALQESSAATPGTKFIYSNTGYALAGAMIETSAGETWEELVRKRIFEPLDLRSAGFGPPTRDENIDQPWGHSWIDNRAQAVPPTDNPLAIAPGGGVHMSILDLARYAAFHLAAAQGKVASLRPFQTALYEPPENSAYALGWKVEKHDWAGGNALTHAGSNTYFFAVIWIAPARDFACVVATNIGDHGNIVAMKCDLVVADLIKQFIP